MGVLPYNPRAGFIHSLLCFSCFQCLKDLLGSVDVLAPTVPDAGIQIALTNAAKYTQACLADLRQCCATAGPVLQAPPPPLPNLEAAIAARRASQPPAVVKQHAWPSIYTSC